MTFTVRRLASAAIVLAASAAAAPAGWSNVAHVACCDGPIRRAFRAPEPTPAPIRSSSNYTVQYEDSSTFETVRVMKPERYTEEVPVQVKSYYWEPVTSYTRRSYYDPCSGECQQVDVPRTSYVRREECRTETRYLEKVRMVPVEMVREVTERTPVYTYRGPTVRTRGPLQPVTPGASVNEFRSTPQIHREGGGYPTIPGTTLPTTPGGVGLPKEMPKSKSDYIPKIESKARPRPSDYRFNALSTSYTKETGAKLTGEVLAADRATPVSNAKLVFVNAADLDDRRFVTADAFGGFDAKLPAGDWIVYAGRGTGKADKISQFRVADGERVQPTVVLK